MSRLSGSTIHRRALIGLLGLTVLGLLFATLVLRGSFSLVLSAANTFTFTEIASTAGVTAPSDSNGSSVVDVDGDWLEDLVLIGPGGSSATLTLYRSNGSTIFATPMPPVSSVSTLTPWWRPND